MQTLMNCARRIAAGLALSTTASLSAHAACPTTTTGWTRVVAGTDGTTLLFKMAVASNFVTAMQSLANSYLSYLGSSSTYYIEICGNSSGTIKTEVNSYNGTDLFSVFFSADYDKAKTISTTYKRTIEPTLYANGIPVFLLSPNATTADSSSTYPALDYMTQGSGATAEGTVTIISSKVIINKASSGKTYYVSTLAIGDPALAPYGVAAQSILAAMYPGVTQSYYNAGTNVSSSCSSLISGSQWMCAYKNIDYTLQAINNDKVTAGFVSYGQVCSALNTSPPDAKRYIKFPAYPTEQYEVSLYSNSTQQLNSDNFLTYLNIDNPGSTNGMGTTWNTWLGNNCYAAI